MSYSPKTTMLEMSGDEEKLKPGLTYVADPLRQILFREIGTD